MRVETQGQQLRAKKDERPAPKSREWTTVPVIFNGEALEGFLAKGGHWLYFSPDNVEWYKLNTVTLDVSEALVIKAIPRAPAKTDEEKKQARKDRRIARKAKKATTTNDSLMAHVEEQEIKDKLRYQKRKALEEA